MIQPLIWYLRMMDSKKHKTYLWLEVRNAISMFKNVHPSRTVEFICSATGWDKASNFMIQRKSLSVQTSILATTTNKSHLSLKFMFRHYAWICSTAPALTITTNAAGQCVCILAFCISKFERKKLWLVSLCACEAKIL